MRWWEPIIQGGLTFTEICVSVDCFVLGNEEFSLNEAVSLKEQIMSKDKFESSA